ncbi:SCO1860 family LAETG-anchored protein [uncultured Streptomyces sp.]|uniref:SCO1860 family LAETG-anchored protein n=1 Tax=uncultured Streptomyces sp. TaxID=174707 RepID=UPI002613688D|nr:SCO1860 family LAETG-anchored protein [uncultured Streptomyces sp.]
MNSNTFRLAALTAVAAPVALLAGVPAQAATATSSDEGRASAVVLRTGLDVSLLDKAVDMPLEVTLNEVTAPRSAEQTALSVRVEGADGGRPVSVLRADVATSEATVTRKKAEGRSNLVKARVHVPGLPRLSLVEVEKVTSKAVCEVGRKPVAESDVLGHVSVLGKRITLTSGGTTEVDVPGVGKVTLDLSKTSTTSRTAAAAALQLRVSVNPLRLNVANVEGEVTLAGATCTTPGRHGGGNSGGHNGGSGNGGGHNGGSSEGGSDNGGSDNGGSDNGGSDDGGTSDGGAGDGGTDNGGASTGGAGSSDGASSGSTTGTGGSDAGGSGDGDGSGTSGTGGKDSTGGSGDGGTDTDVKTRTGADSSSGSTGNLAETGSSSSTPYLAGGAALLLAVGAGATVLARRRSGGNQG